jgi:hypothetical protein
MFSQARPIEKQLTYLINVVNSLFSFGVPSANANVTKWRETMYPQSRIETPIAQEEDGKNGQQSQQE